MSDQADQRATKRSQTIPLRPLLGIHRDVSPTLIPKGAFFDVEGFLPSDTGLIRRFGFSAIDRIFPDITSWEYLNSFIDDNGGKVTFGIGGGKFWVASGDTFVNVPCEYPNVTSPAGTTAATIAGSRTITGVSTEWKTLGGFVKGDTIYIDGTGETLRIEQVVDDLTITAFDVAEFSSGASDYVITHELVTPADWAIQVVRLDRRLFIVTGTNTVMVYNLDHPEAVYTYWEMADIEGITLTVTTNLNFIPKTIDVFKDRIWTGNIFSDLADRWYTNRISWTPVLSSLDFQPDGQFNNLVKIGGDITCIRAMGNLLMVYFDNGAQYGRETQVPGDIFPLAFDVVETSRSGVYNPNCVASGQGGHFFVSSTNVYYLSQQLQMAPISEEVKEILYGSDVSKQGYKIGNFSESEGLFVASKALGRESYNKLWAYNYTTREWTQFSISADYISIFSLGTRLSYSDYPENQIYGADPLNVCNDDTWDTTRDVTTQFFTNYDVQSDDMSNGYGSPALNDFVPIYARRAEDALTNQILTVDDYTTCKASYGGTSSAFSEELLYITNGAPIYVFDLNAIEDYDGSDVVAMFETGDFDLGLPDTYKTYYKMAFRLDKQAPAELKFHIQSSNDSGLTWYDMGDLYIYENGKEGRCNFIHTGSAARFRVSSSTESAPYIIVEITLDVKLRGRQSGDY